MNDANSQVEKIIGCCPKCGPEKNADVVCHHPVHWDDDEIGAAGHIDYYILKCRGCDSIYYKRVETCSECVSYIYNPYTGEDEEYCPEDISYWPAPTKRPSPEWLYKLKNRDFDLGSLFEDVYSALNNDLAILAAIAIRTTFDRASELLNVDPDFTFKKKLNCLEENGIIGTDERKTLDLLTDAGSAAAHRGWKPSAQELETMTSIIEAFLYRVFILNAAASQLTSSIPQKTKKRHKNQC